MLHNNQYQSIDFKSYEVLYLNTELKQLPFPSKDWKLNIFIPSLDMLYQPSNKLAQNYETAGLLQKLNFDDTINPVTGKPLKSIKVVIIDSLTRVQELIIDYAKRKGVTGWDVWTLYAEILRGIFRCTGNYKNRFIIYTGLSEDVISSDGVIKSYVKAQGQLKKEVESYFSVVLWSIFDKSESCLDLSYKYLTNTNGDMGAKTPMKMFKEKTIPNDITIILKSIIDYYGFDIYSEDQEFIPPNILIAGDSGYGKTASFRNLIKEKEEE